jgi:probable HAF family extracellular repeat protein
MKRPKDYRNDHIARPNPYRARLGAWLACLSAIGLLAIPAANAQYTPYEVTDLGTLGGDSSSAAGLNNRGEVVGTSDNGAKNFAFVWSKGRMTNLGTIYGGTTSSGYAINDSGQVVGTAIGLTRSGFVYSGGTMSGFPRREFSALSANGLVVGGYLGGTYQQVPSYGCIWDISKQQETFLGTLGGQSLYQGSWAYAINTNGDIVGEALTTNRVMHAFLLHAGTMTDIATSIDSNLTSSAKSINDLGQIAGMANGRAFLYDAGIMHDLGTLGGSSSGATCVNNSGQVVGSALTAAGTSHGFIYQSGLMTDLNDLITDGTWTITSASGINTNGQIAANGTNAQGKSHALLLTPGPNLQKAVRLSFCQLPIGNTCQIQASTNLAVWTNAGAAFLATNTSMTCPDYLEVGNQTACFFRLPGAQITRLQKAVKPVFAGLKVGTNYQVQTTGDHKTWTNQGSAFTATDPRFQSSQYLDVSDWSKLSFRLQIAP